MPSDVCCTQLTEKQLLVAMVKGQKEMATLLRTFVQGNVVPPAAPASATPAAPANATPAQDEAFSLTPSKKGFGKFRKRAVVKVSAPRLCVPNWQAHLHMHYL